MKNIFLVFCLLFVILCSSCRRYIADRHEELPHFYKDSLVEYTMQPGDIISISLLTTNDEINELFGKNSRMFQTNMTGGGHNNSYSNGYSLGGTNFELDADGNVFIPLIGKRNFTGKTIDQIKKELQEDFDEKFVDCIVNVKMVNFNIYFLGEISNGVKNFNTTHVNFLQALSVAGGINQYGKYKNVMVIRKGDHGNTVFRVNVKERELLCLSNFYLYPGDIVYVESRPFRYFQRGLQEYTTYLSLITSAMSTYYIFSRNLK